MEIRIELRREETHDQQVGERRQQEKGNISVFQPYLPAKAYYPSFADKIPDQLYRFPLQKVPATVLFSTFFSAAFFYLFSSFFGLLLFLRDTRNGEKERLF